MAGISDSWPELWLVKLAFEFFSVGVVFKFGLVALHVHIRGELVLIQVTVYAKIFDDFPGKTQFAFIFEIFSDNFHIPLNDIVVSVIVQSILDSI